MALGLRLNMDYVEQRFAQVWEEDPAKMFTVAMPQQPMQPPQAGGQQGGVQAPKVSPQIKVPGQGQQASALR